MPEELITIYRCNICDSSEYPGYSGLDVWTVDPSSDSSVVGLYEASDVHRYIYERAVVMQRCNCLGSVARKRNLPS